MGRISGASVQRTTSDKLFDMLNTILLILVLIIVIYPIYFMCIASISDPNIREESFYFRRTLHYWDMNGYSPMTSYGAAILIP